jgi:superoxide dismutase, Fe-Mn family
MALTLPALPYAYDALQPYMSKETLEFHHDKHHQAYVTNANKLMEGKGLEILALDDLVQEVFGKEPGLFNNVGQHYNHVHFWNWMKPNGGGGATKVPAALAKAIDSDLGDFINAGTTQFGSGWAWLSLKNGKLEVTKTPNGENPLVHGGKPLLGVDVWEHSYYIDYRNARPKYLEAWFDNLVNWEHVELLYEEAK